MRIIVILGRVLDPSGIIVKGKAGRIFVNREEYILQPADRCALEAALRLKDAMGCEVVVLPRTLMPDDDVLRQALARGADRAVYLQGEGPGEMDVGGMTPVLVAAIERLGGGDLVLTGAVTLDTGQGQLGPRLAGALGWPQILEAWQVNVMNDAVRAVQQRNGSYVTVEAHLPAVVTLRSGSLKLRYPDGVRLINVYRGVGEIAEALMAWNVTDLVAEDVLHPQLDHRGRDFPPDRERGVRVEGTPVEAAQAVAKALRQRVRQ